MTTPKLSVICTLYNLSHANFNFESIIHVYQLSSVLVQRRSSRLLVLFRLEIHLEALLFLPLLFAANYCESIHNNLQYK